MPDGSNRFPTVSVADSHKLVKSIALLSFQLSSLSKIRHLSVGMLRNFGLRLYTPNEDGMESAALIGMTSNQADEGGYA